MGQVLRSHDGYGVAMGAGAGTVDTHVHLLPGRLGEKVRAYFAAGEAAGRFTLPYPAGHEGVLAALCAEGVSEVWTLPYAHRRGVAEWLNASTAAMLSEFPPGGVKVLGGLTVHPDDDDPAGVIARAVEKHGLRVLKLHCSVGGFDADDPRLVPALACAEEHRLPTVIHLGRSSGGLTEPGELAAIDTVCARHPDLPVVLAHFGHHSAPAAAFLFDRPNFHADLTPVVTEPPAVPRGLMAARADRILFGSDAPNTAITVTDHLAWLGSYGLDEESWLRITGGNARRLAAAVRM